jgi:hypothetical protein
MHDLGSLNLINFLSFYFAFMFLTSMLRRLNLYLRVIWLVWLGRDRWPLLFKLVSHHWMIFVTWSTVLPGLLLLALWMIQLLLSDYLLPEAATPPTGLTIERVLEHWPALFAIVPLGLGMMCCDLYFLFAVFNIKEYEGELKKQFDQAEFWLDSTRAHVVRVVTFGFVNPRRMVHEKVQDNLLYVSQIFNTNLWWFIGQTGLRFGFALSLWLTWAVTQ